MLLHKLSEIHILKQSYRVKWCPKLFHRLNHLCTEFKLCGQLHHKAHLQHLAFFVHFHLSCHWSGHTHLLIYDTAMLAHSIPYHCRHALRSGQFQCSCLPLTPHAPRFPIRIRDTAIRVHGVYRRNSFRHWLYRRSSYRQSK